MTRRLATVRDYDGLHRTIRARVDELGFTREEIDDAAQLLGEWPERYASKLLAPIPIKALGRTSLGPMLQVLGLQLAAEVVEEQPRISKSPKSMPYKRHQHKPVKLGGNVPEIRALGRKALREILKKNGRKGGKLGGRVRAQNLTKSQRRHIARKAGMASAKARRAKHKANTMGALPINAEHASAGGSKRRSLAHSNTPGTVHVLSHPSALEA